MRVKGRAILESLTDEATPLRLTLLVFLLRPPGEGTLRGLTWLVAGLALVVPPLARSAATWIALAGLVLARLVLEWPLSDNHIYLLGYWSLGLGLCLLVPSPFAAIAAMSRWLLGSAFLCAILWKALLAPDFLDGRFFRVTLIADERFADLARTVGGLSDSQLDANRAALAALPPGADVIDGPVLVEPPALRRLGLMLTWGGLLLEALVAAAFLSPRPAALHRGRHVALLTFAGVTYAIAPVAGFGWLLTAMGLAGCEPDRRALRLAYVAMFALVLAYAETALVPYGLSALSVGLR
jgi:hypothetical protein